MDAVAVIAHVERALEIGYIAVRVAVRGVQAHDLRLAAPLVGAVIAEMEHDVPTRAVVARAVDHQRQTAVNLQILFG